MNRKRLRGRKRFGSIYRRGRIWWIAYTADGKQQCESSGSQNKPDAEELLKKRLTEHARDEGGPKKLRMSALLDDLLEYYRVHRPRSYRDFAKPFVDGTAGLRAYFGKMKPTDVTTGAVKQFQEALLADGAASATVNRKTALLRRAFNLALSTTPPKVTRAPRFHKLPEHNTRSGFLSWSDYDRLMEAIEPSLKPLLLIAYHTGARRSELMGIKLSQVDLAASRITLRSGETKNNQGRVLPIYGEMVERLRAHIEETRQQYPDCEYLCHWEGRQLCESKTRRDWMAAVKAVGLDGLLIHDLRRSAARNMRDAGMHEHAIMKVGGWKSGAMFQRYDIITDDDVQQEVRKMAAQAEGSRRKRGAA